MRQQDEGTVTVFVVSFMLALLVVAGLVVDGGYVLAARREAANVAESAARAGAQEIDVSAARAGNGVTLDPVAAEARADAYLRASGHSGTVLVLADRVRVRVTITRRMTLLGLAGVGDATVTADGEARSVRAVREDGT